MSIPIKKMQSGFELPALGFGTWRMGQGTTYGQTLNDEKEIRAIHQAVERGLIHIDTAELYGAGYVEELISTALNGIDRSKYFLTSKVNGQNATKVGIHKAVRESLRRLKTNYLDLYLIHFRSEGVDLEEGITALNEILEDGLVKNIGVSNFKTETLALAQSYSKNKLVCNQVQYNLEHREAEANGLLDYCQKNDVLLVGWGPVRPITSQTQFIPVIAEITQKYNKSAQQIAINWLASQNNVATLVKASNLQHLQEDIDAVDFIMAPEDIEKLRNFFPGQIQVSAGFPMR